MSVQHAVNNRPTDDVIVVTFKNWTEFILYDTRRTSYDVPRTLADYPVESIHTTENLTIIEI